MKPLSAGRRLAALLAAAVALLGWFGARYLNAPEAFGALISRASVRSGATLQPGAALSRGASDPGALATSGKPTQQAAARAAAMPVGNASEGAVGQTPRARLVALRAPLSPDAQSDPFSVQSWLPPPPPPPPAPVVTAQEAPPSAPPLPFSYVGTLNRDRDKPQVFLANGEQLLIVSPGDVIDGRYRFESIAATGAVFTYLPLNEKQVMAIEGEDTK